MTAKLERKDKTEITNCLSVFLYLQSYRYFNCIKVFGGESVFQIEGQTIHISLNG